MAKKTDQQVDKELRDELKRVDYEYIKDRKLSNHPDDWYLRVVLAKNSREYVVWVYNASLGGLQGGKYLTDLKEAEKYYESR